MKKNLFSYTQNKECIGMSFKNVNKGALRGLGFIISPTKYSSFPSDFIFLWWKVAVMRGVDGFLKKL